MPTSIEDETKVRQELDRIRNLIQMETGVVSRWNGRVVIVPYDSPYRGLKPFVCDIHLRSDLVNDPMRWRTLIHEMLHSVSAGYNQVDYNFLTKTTGIRSPVKSKGCLGETDMTFKTDDPERHRLFRQAHDAGTPEEWEAAWNALLNWKRRHPDDSGVEDAFEMLALLKSSVSEPMLVTAH